MLPRTILVGLIAVLTGCSALLGLDEYKVGGGADTDTDTDTDSDTDTDTDTDIGCDPICADPIEIASLPFSDSGSTAGGQSCMDAYTCSPQWEETGPEIVYSYTPAGNETITAEISNAIDEVNIIILADLGEGCEPDVCVREENTTIENYCLLGGFTYFFVVDGLDGAEGEYDLDITSGGSCTTACNIHVVEDFSESTMPDDWIVEDGESDSLTWHVSTTPNALVIPFHMMEDGFMMVDSRTAGDGVFMEESLITPWHHADGCQEVTVSFDHYYRDELPDDSDDVGRFEIQVGNDTAPWITIEEWSDSLTDTTHECFSLSSYIDPWDSFRLRFYYTTGTTWGWFWYVDNVTVSSIMSCEPNYVFTLAGTSITPAGLGGLAGADALCQSAADGSSVLPPGRTYVAWLSTSSVNAIDRLAGARGWIRPDGKPFADTPSDIALGRILHPLSLDEDGSTVNTTTMAVTGTDMDGSLYSSGVVSTCGDWTSSSNETRVGGPWGTTNLWTNRSNVSCATDVFLYCFGTDHKTRVVPQPTDGRIAFLSDATLPLSTAPGLVGADAICQSEAVAAGLPGNYWAMLATSTNSAVWFFSTGLPWKRVDNVLLNATADGILVNGVLSTPLNVNALGEYQMNYGVWSGAISVTDVGSPTTTCDNWTSTLTTYNGYTGIASLTDEWFYKFSANCTALSRVYCFQQ